MHLKNMPLRTRLLLAGISLTLVPMLVMGIVVWRQNRAMTEIAGAESMRLTYADLDNIATSVYSLCMVQHEIQEAKVRSDLNVAFNELAHRGGFVATGETVTWDARNQFNNQTMRVTLPRMRLGNQLIDPEQARAGESQVVDRVQQMVGGTSTIFQRMNGAGDMLRISTNVRGADGNRASGTYIPAVNPDGTPNPVIAAVLRGQDFVGRAFVVSAWYITAYRPLYDDQRQVAGMVYVGVPQEGAASFRTQIMDIKVGTTGYVFVLDTEGHYVISDQGTRDGEKIWEARDANGRLFIQEMVAVARQLRPAEIGELNNPGGIRAIPCPA